MHAGTEYWIEVLQASVASGLQFDHIHRLLQLPPPRSSPAGAEDGP